MDQHIAEVYADYLMLPLFDMAPDEADPKLAGLLPEKLCREHLMVPVALNEDTLDVAFATFEDMLMVDELQLLTGLTIRPMIAPLSVVEKTIEMLYRADAHQVHQPTWKTIAAEDEEDDGGARAGAAERGDSGHRRAAAARPRRPHRPHGQPDSRAGAADRGPATSTSSRSRIPAPSGCGWTASLRELTPPPRSQFVPIVSRFKILAKMDIAEKRVPQDGAIALKSGDKRVDLRVSTVPTVYGEKMVMRILDKGAIPIELTGLGFDERQSKDLIESIQMPHGLMLVTGPTGSGKSTTLYACLNKLNEPDTNICTVEDPVEYKFKGMNQVQVKTQVGLTFAGALRAFLRQDPDVIMVGEVRDQETAQICLRAALTGHFVLSTIHTNDSLSAVNRLAGHGDRAVPAGLDAAGAGGPAAHPPALQGVQGAVRVRRRDGQTARAGGGPDAVSAQGLRRTAAGPATGAASACSRWCASPPAWPA